MTDINKFYLLYFILYYMQTYSIYSTTYTW